MSTAITTAATNSRSTSSSTTTITTAASSTGLFTFYSAISDNTHYNQSSNRKSRSTADSSLWRSGYIKWCRFDRFGFQFEWGSDSVNYYFVRLDTGFRYDCNADWSKYSYSNVYSADSYNSDISSI